MRWLDSLDDQQNLRPQTVKRVIHCPASVLTVKVKPRVAIAVVRTPILVMPKAIRGKSSWWNWSEESKQRKLVLLQQWHEQREKLASTRMLLNILLHGSSLTCSHGQKSTSLATTLWCFGGGGSEWFFLGSKRGAPAWKSFWTLLRPQQIIASPPISLMIPTWYSQMSLMGAGWSRELYQWWTMLNHWWCATKMVKMCVTRRSWCIHLQFAYQKQSSYSGMLGLSQNKHCIAQAPPGFGAPQTSAWWFCPDISAPCNCLYASPGCIGTQASDLPLCRTVVIGGSLESPLRDEQLSISIPQCTHQSYMWQLSTYRSISASQGGQILETNSKPHMQFGVCWPIIQCKAAQAAYESVAVWQRGFTGRYVDPLVWPIMLSRIFRARESKLLPPAGLQVHGALIRARFCSATAGSVGPRTQGSSICQRT